MKRPSPLAMLRNLVEAFEADEKFGIKFVTSAE